MSKRIQRRRGTTLEHATFTGAQGEITVDTDKDVVVVHDGMTPGGFPQVSAKALAEPDGSTKVGYDGGTVQDVLDAVTGPNGAASVGYQPAGTGAVATTVHDRLRFHDLLVVSVTDPRFAGGAKGDGSTDDTSAIQAAIDHVADSGADGVVTVPPGTFIFTSITNKTGVTLRGEGGVLKLKDNTCTNASTSYYIIHNIGHTKSRFIDLIVDGNAANNSLFTVADAITCVGEMSEVRGCRITNAPDSGIMFSIAPYSRCIGNTINVSRDIGIYVNGNNNTSDSGIRAAIVAMNTIVGAPYGAIALKRSAGYITVFGNTFDDCGNGITVEDFGGGIYPSSCVITCNIGRRIGTSYTAVSDVQKSGITVSRGKNITITSNQMYDCEGFGFYGNDLEKCTVSCNTFVGNSTGTFTPSAGHNGINLDQGTDTANINCSFCDNTVSGFRNRSASFTAIQRSTVSKNRFVGDIATGVTSGAGHQGLVFVNGGTQPSRGNTIQGNIATGYKSNGINLAGLSDSTVMGNLADTSDEATATALRIGSLAVSNIIVGNICKGASTSTDLSYTVGATNNLLDKNILQSFTGVEKFMRRNTGIASPVGAVVPRWEGEQYITTSGGVKLWQSYGSTNADWLQIG